MARPRVLTREQLVIAIARHYLEAAHQSYIERARDKDLPKEDRVESRDAALSPDYVLDYAQDIQQMGHNDLLADVDEMMVTLAHEHARRYPSK